MEWLGDSPLSSSNRVISVFLLWRHAYLHPYVFSYFEEIRLMKISHRKSYGQINGIRFQQCLLKNSIIFIYRKNVKHCYYRTERR